MSSFAAEPIFYIGTIPITNTSIHTLVVDVLLIGTALFVSKHIQYVPSGFQNAIEAVMEAMYNLADSVSHHSIKQVFPYVMTFFLFIFIANFTSLLPGFGSIGFFPTKEKIEITSPHQELKKDTQSKEVSTQSKHTEDFIPLLRGATSDINVTLALALVSVVATHMLSIKLTGIKDYLSRYFSFNPINLYVGLLELVAEFTKIVSLAFRLFGNIYAGEFALGTVSKIFAFLFPLPFLFLENIVALVQALVFSILTLVFMSILTKSHHGETH